jgi:glyoxylase-like metal-dependent hydrolase (beta-lactamase superfamily II)
MSLHVKSAGEEAMLIGDVAHHPVQMFHLDWSTLADSDPVQAAETRRALFSQVADKPVMVIGGHFGGGYVKRRGDGFEFAAA